MPDGVVRGVVARLGDIEGTGPHLAGWDRSQVRMDVGPARASAVFARWRVSSCVVAIACHCARASPTP